MRGVRNIYQNSIAVDGKLFPVKRTEAVQNQTVIDQTGNLCALPGTYGNDWTAAYDLRDAPFGCAGKSGKFYAPDSLGSVVGMADKRGDQKPLVLLQDIGAGSCFDLPGSLLCLQIMIERIA